MNTPPTRSGWYSEDQRALRGGIAAVYRTRFGREVTVTALDEAPNAWDAIYIAEVTERVCRVNLHGEVVPDADVKPWDSEDPRDMFAHSLAVIADIERQKLLDWTRVFRRMVPPRPHLSKELSDIFDQMIRQFLDKHAPEFEKVLKDGDLLRTPPPRFPATRLTDMFFDRHLSPFQSDTPRFEQKFESSLQEGGLYDRVTASLEVAAPDLRVSPRSPKHPFYAPLAAAVKDFRDRDTPPAEPTT